jgi:Gpi18-like mannosyltransferase
LVALFAAEPMGVVLSMTYTEALFCALALWALVGVLERRWLLAGLCTAAAGLVRWTALALVITVGLAAVVSLARRRESRPLIALLIAPAGLIGYLWWTGVQVRPGGEQLRAWFDLERQG